MPRKKTNSKQHQKQDTVVMPTYHLEMKKVSPLTYTQEKVFEAYDEGKNLVFHGYAGTGKSFLGMYLPLDEILYGDSPYRKLTIIRSAVPGRDQGFLPGTLKEKSKIYELPYVAVANELFGRGDAYEILKNKNIIEFETTMSLRGVTFNNGIVFVDEIQNMTFQELDTIMTRCGNKCKYIFSGDFRQVDLKKHEETGISRFLKILDCLRSFKTIEFSIDDIVRSGVVKEYIIAKTDEELL